jgi:hypothetical protein
MVVNRQSRGFTACRVVLRLKINHEWNNIVTRISKKGRNVKMNIGIHRRKLRGAAIVLASFMVAWLILGQITGFAAQPKIMVSDYKVSEEYIEAGGSFNLSITIKNTADKKVSNLKISVASENGDIIPSSGAGTDYLAELAGGEEHTFTFPMKAGKNIEEQSYKINVVNEYDDRYGTAWTVTDSINYRFVLGGQCDTGRFSGDNRSGK